jgi:hypothetical protein
MGSFACGRLVFSGQGCDALRRWHAAMGSHSRFWRLRAACSAAPARHIGAIQPFADRRAAAGSLQGACCERSSQEVLVVLQTLSWLAGGRFNLRLRCIGRYLDPAIMCTIRHKRCAGRNHARYDQSDLHNGRDYAGAGDYPYVV